MEFASKRAQCKTTCEKQEKQTKKRVFSKKRECDNDQCIDCRNCSSGRRRSRRFRCCRRCHRWGRRRRCNSCGCGCGTRQNWCRCSCRWGRHSIVPRDGDIGSGGRSARAFANFAFNNWAEKWKKKRWSSAGR